jgi:hypothetical protein
MDMFFDITIFVMDMYLMKYFSSIFLGIHGIILRSMFLLNFTDTLFTS